MALLALSSGVGEGGQEGTEAQKEEVGPDIGTLAQSTLGLLEPGSILPLLSTSCLGEKLASISLLCKMRSSPENS